MTAVPSIVMMTMLAMLSMFAALILSRPWMRYVAVGCAGAEIIMIAILLFAIRH